MRKKVLVVCLGAQVRSVALKDALNLHHDCDAWALSAISNSDSVFTTNCLLADIIVAVEPRTLPKGPVQWAEMWFKCRIWDDAFAHKRKVIDLGPDVWGNSRHPALMDLVARRAREVLS